jgi:hypothetical protein
MMTGLVIGVASSLFTLLVVFAVAQSLKRGGAKELRPRLTSMTRRLQQAVAELLARADDLDQDLRFMGGKTRPETSNRVAKACGDLALLQDAVKVIEDRIASQDLKKAQEDLIISLGVANKLSEEINDLREEIRLKRLSG